MESQEIIWSYKTGKYINLADTKPKLNEEVLVCYENEPFTHAVAALEERNGKLVWNNHDMYCDFENYTMWMPLPGKDI